MPRRSQSWCAPWGPAASRTPTSAGFSVRTSCGCLLPVRNSFLRAAEGVPDAALERVCRALDQEGGGRGRQNVVTVQGQTPLLDVDPAHPPEECFGRRRVGFVLQLAELSADAADAADLDVQGLHDGEPAAGK